MNAIIQQFQNELTREERVLFEAHARHAGHRPGQHLKALLFRQAQPGTKQAMERREQKAESRKLKTEH